SSSTHRHSPIPPLFPYTTLFRSETMPLDDFLSQGLMEAQNLLVIDLERCTRCDQCVRACAEAHDGVTRLVRDGLRYDKYLVATSDRKSTRLNSSHVKISYAVFCL